MYAPSGSVVISRPCRPPPSSSEADRTTAPAPSPNRMHVPRSEKSRKRGSDAPLADAGALHDPLIGRVHDALQICVREASLGRVHAPAGDADALGGRAHA